MVRHHRQRFLSFSSPCYLTYSSYQDTKFPEQTQCWQRKMTGSCNEMQPLPAPNTSLSWTRAHLLTRKKRAAICSPPYLSGQRFPSGRHSLSGILFRQASFSVRHPFPSGPFSVRHSSPSGILSRQTIIPARHPSPSGIHPCQASFSVRHSSPSGFLLLSGILPFQSMDHIHHKLVAWHRYAYLCRGTDNRTADGIHLALPAVP